MERWLEMAKSNLVRDGHLVAVLHVECDGPPLLMAIEDMPPTADARRWLLWSIGRRVAARRPTRATMVMDAYVGPWESRDDLEDEPRAQECVIAATLDRAGTHRVLLARYEREPRLEGTSFTFLPPEEHRTATEMMLLSAFFEGAAAR